MMISRRWFVIGSAAALAATQIPDAVAPTPAQCTLRFVEEIMATTDATENGDALVEMFRMDRLIFSMAMNQRSVFLWKSTPGSEIILPPSDALILSLKAACGFGKIDMICRDRMSDGSEVHVLESHTFPSRGPPTILRLEP